MVPAFVMDKCSTKWPPLLVNEDHYEVWRSDLLIWCDLCELDATKRAQAVHLSLPLGSRARDATSEIPREDLKKSTGVDIIIAKLDEVFLSDKSRRQFSAFKALYNLRRPTNVSVSDFVKDFEHAYFKFKAQDMKLPDTVMALMLLASCSLSDNESQLVMASLVDINYTAMKSALKRIFDKDIEKAPGIATVDIKTEPNFYGGDCDGASSAGSTRGDNVYYARSRPRGRARGGRGAYSYRGRGRAGKPVTGANSEPIGGEYSNSRKMNPVDSEGNVSRCVICDSRLHWARDCPHSYEKMKSPASTDTADDTVELSLFMGLTGVNDGNSKLSSLMHESSGCAVLDSGCINTVCGSAWLQRYTDFLSDNDRAKLKEESSEKSFTFGDGVMVTSVKRVTLPCFIGKKRATIVTDVVNCNIPLLMSKTSMKRAKMSINFETDSAIISGNGTSLRSTTSGHYILPLTR